MKKQRSSRSLMTFAVLALILYKAFIAPAAITVTTQAVAAPLQQTQIVNISQHLDQAN